MTGSSGDLAKLQHMLDAVRSARDFSGHERATFDDSPLIQSGASHQLMILGEAAKAVSPATKVRWPGLPWREMAGMRDVLIHHYFGVDYDTVWEVVTNELPKVEAVLVEMVAELRAEEES